MQHENSTISNGTLLKMVERNIVEHLHCATLNSAISNSETLDSATLNSASSRSPTLNSGTLI